MYQLNECNRCSCFWQRFSNPQKCIAINIARCSIMCAFAWNSKNIHTFYVYERTSTIWITDLISSARRKFETFFSIPPAILIFQWKLEMNNGYWLLDQISFSIHTFYFFSLFPSSSSSSSSSNKSRMLFTLIKLVE